MSTGNRHTLYAVTFSIPGGTSYDMFCDQVTDFAVSPAIAEVLESGDGAIDPTYVAVGTQTPSVTWSSTGIATVLAKCGIAGVPVDASATKTGVLFSFQKMTEGGTRTTGANHITLTMAEGMVVPRTLSADQGGNATISLEAVCSYDGTNDPLELATSQTLTGSPAVAELYTLGPVKINGTDIADAQGVTVDFGIRLLTESGDGQVWPTWIGIATRQPSITVRTRNVELLNTYGLPGVVLSGSTKVYFRKRSEGGTLVADTTAQHTSITINEGRVEVSRVAGSIPLMADVKITPTWNGTNAIFVISTATTIT